MGTPLSEDLLTEIRAAVALGPVPNPHLACSQYRGHLRDLLGEVDRLKAELEEWQRATEGLGQSVQDDLSDLRQRGRVVAEVSHLQAERQQSAQGLAELEKYRQMREGKP